MVLPSQHNIYEPVSHQKDRLSFPPTKQLEKTLRSSRFVGWFYTYSQNKENYYNNHGKNELIGQLIDIFEDYLTEKGIASSEDAFINGKDYNDISKKLENTLKNWCLIDDSLNKNNISCMIYRNQPQEYSCFLSSEMNCVEFLLTYLVRYAII